MSELNVPDAGGVLKNLTAFDMDKFKRATMEQLHIEIKSYATVGMSDEGNPELTAQEIADFIGEVHGKLIEITNELAVFCQSDLYFRQQGNYLLEGDAYREELYEKGIYNMIDEISSKKAE